MTAQQYGRFLIEVFEEWARHDVGDVFVPMFDTTLARFLGMRQGGMCTSAKVCGDDVRAHEAQGRGRSRRSDLRVV